MDNYYNSWGRDYMLGPAPNRRGDTYTIQNMEAFEATVKASTEGMYEVAAITANGTQANTIVISAVEHREFNGDSPTVLVATGCYVGGSGRGFEPEIMVNRSTSVIESHSLSFIKAPWDLRTTAEAKALTVPLPYYIPTAAGIDSSGYSIEEYEDSCLRELHLTCLLLRSDGKPVKALLLELMLGGNGAYLSDSVLERLGDLAHIHDFCFIVDEVMTGGRVDGSLLLTQQTPPRFRNKATYVTMGKWMGMGLVLIKTTEKERETSSEEVRSMTTNLATTNANECFEIVRREHKQIVNRRKEVLDRLDFKGNKVDETWGRGLLIFVPAINSASIRGGLKQRYLPHITATTPDPPKLKRKASYLLDKQGCSNRVVTGVRAWIEYRKVRAHQRNSVTLPSMAPRILMSVGIQRAGLPNPYISLDDMWTQFEACDRRLSRSRNKDAMLAGLDAAAAFGLITYVAKGSSRKRSIVFGEMFRR
jgi:hypothetical protein